MKEIKLTQGYFAIVDDSDFEFLSQWKWCVKIMNYVRTQTNYAHRGYYENGFVTSLLMHRVLLRITDRKVCVDHKDGNGLNNQRGNLRIATPSQNAANKKSIPGSTSKYIGVCWHKDQKVWVAQIRKDYKIHHLGRFTNEVDAAVAYNKAAVEKHGKFASLNIIDSFEKL